MNMLNHPNVAQAVILILGAAVLTGGAILIYAARAFKKIDQIYLAHAQEQKGGVQ